MASSTTKTLTRNDDSNSSEPQNDSQNILYFNSGVKEPYFMLSNLHFAPVKMLPEDVTPEMLEVCPQFRKWLGGEGKRFESIESIWHALKLKPAKNVVSESMESAAFKKFTECGQLSDCKVETFELFLSQKEKPKAAKKREYWMKKQMVGILPKMASNKKYEIRLGLKGRMDYSRERLAPQIEKPIWKKLLHMKYRQNPRHKQVLLSTRGKRLVEFSRMAQSMEEKGGKKEKWGGYVDENGKLWGENTMGKLLEEVREELASSSS